MGREGLHRLVGRGCIVERGAELVGRGDSSYTSTTHQRESIFSISVTSPVEKLGTPIQIIHWVRPWGVAVNQKSEVVVTGWGYDCMSVFSPSGQKLRSFGTGGSG